MLFNNKGFREFFATQSNGEPRRVEYTVDTNGNAKIQAVDGIPVTNYDPLPAQFAFVVHGWIEDHRRDLSSHSGFYDIEEHRSAA